MQYQKYRAWLQSGISNPTTASMDDNKQQYSDARVKKYLNELNKDDTARKMLGLSMLKNGVIDKGTLDILMLKQLSNYF